MSRTGHADGRMRTSRLAVPLLLTALSISGTASAQRMAPLDPIENCNREPSIQFAALCAVENLEFAQRVAEAEALLLAHRSRLLGDGAVGVSPDPRVGQTCERLRSEQAQFSSFCTNGGPDVDPQCRIRAANNQVFEGQTDLSYRALFATRLLNRSDVLDPDLSLRNRLILALANNRRVLGLIASTLDGRSRAGELQVFFDRGCGVRWQLQGTPDRSVLLSDLAFEPTSDANEAATGNFFQAAGLANAIADYLSRFDVDATTGQCETPFPGLRRACLDVFNQMQVVLGQSSRLDAVPSRSVRAATLEGERMALQLARSQAPSPVLRIQTLLPSLSIATGLGGREQFPFLYGQFRCAVENVLFGVSTCSFDPTPKVLNTVKVVARPR